MRPRHYVLIAVIVALGVFNYFRVRRAQSTQQATPVSIATGPVPQSPSWNAFDKADALRDAAESQFSAQLQTLDQTVQAAPATDPTIAEVKGCQMWLMFYRQGIVHPSKDTSWRDRSTKHLDECVKTHHDAG